MNKLEYKDFKFKDYVKANPMIWGVLIFLVLIGGYSIYDGVWGMTAFMGVILLVLIFGSVSSWKRTRKYYESLKNKK